MLRLPAIVIGFLHTPRKAMLCSNACPIAALCERAIQALSENPDFYCPKLQNRVLWLPWAGRISLFRQSLALVDREHLRGRELNPIVAIRLRNVVFGPKAGSLAAPARSTAAMLGAGHPIQQADSSGRIDEKNGKIGNLASRTARTEWPPLAFIANQRSVSCVLRWKTGGDDQ